MQTALIDYIISLYIDVIFVKSMNLRTYKYVNDQSMKTGIHELMLFQYRDI